NEERYGMRARMGSRNPSSPKEEPRTRGKRRAPTDLNCRLEMGHGKDRVVRAGLAVITDDELRFRTGRTGRDGRDFFVHVALGDVRSVALAPSGMAITVTPAEAEAFTLHLGKHAPAWKQLVEGWRSR